MKDDHRTDLDLPAPPVPGVPGVPGVTLASSGRAPGFSAIKTVGHSVTVIAVSVSIKSLSFYR